MCLILFAYKSHPTYKLILAANRDEDYDRPSAPAAFRDEAPGILAGRDLRAGGTWLGITTSGRIAAITNYRDPNSQRSDAPSRGELVSAFLLGKEMAADYLDRIAQRADQYNGFNLIIGNGDELYWYSNRSNGMLKLRPGLYGLSNCLLNTPWAKVTLGRDALTRIITKQEDPSPEALFHLLRDCHIPDDSCLPDTGVGLVWERILAPIFITSPTYGTRSSTVLLIDMNDRVKFLERTFHSHPERATTVKYEFQIEY